MTYKYGSKVRFKTFFGETKEGIIKATLSDGSFFIEIDEQILPHLQYDCLCKDPNGRTFVVHKQRFPNWQAWVRPDWIIGEVKENSRG